MKIIMICTGNICRSPMAEGVLRHLCEQQNRTDLEIDSAGIENYHQGQHADQRAIHIMQKNGYDITQLRARQITEADVIPAHHTLMVATQAHKYSAEILKTRCHGKATIIKMLKYHPNQSNHDLADPYYGNEQDFEIVLQTLETALTHWLEKGE